MAEPPHSRACPSPFLAGKGRRGSVEFRDPAGGVPSPRAPDRPALAMTEPAPDTIRPTAPPGPAPSASRWRRAWRRFRRAAQRARKALFDQIRNGARRFLRERKYLLQRHKPVRPGHVLLATNKLAHDDAGLSLLRIALQLKDDGFRPQVASAKDGPLRSEFEKAGIPVRAVGPSARIRWLLRGLSAEVAIVNSATMPKIYRRLALVVPTIWLMREPPAPLLANSRSGRARILEKILARAENVFATTPDLQREWAAFHPGIGLLGHGGPDGSRDALPDILRAVAPTYRCGTAGPIDIRAILAAPRTPAPPMPMSIVIPVYNAPDDLRLCLDSLLDGGISPTTEILLMDDCSAPETAALMQRYARLHPQIRLVRNDRNLGFVGNCNAGVRLAANDLAVLLNSDTAVPKGFEERIRRCFRSDRNIAIASPVATHSALFHLTDRLDDLPAIDDALRRRKPTYPLFTPEGFCFAIRRSLLHRDAPFDAAFGKGYKEEEDLVMWALQHGHRTVLVDDLAVFHRRTASFPAGERKALLRRNEQLYRRRWGGQRECIRHRYGICRLVGRLNRRFRTAPGGA